MTSFVSPILRRSSIARLVCTLALCAGVTLASAQNRAPDGKPGEKKSFSLAEKTSEAMQKLGPLTNEGKWDEALKLLDSVPTVPGSFDEATILDIKAKIYAQQGKYSEALVPWERALQLSDQHGYFQEKSTNEIVFYLGQLYAQEALTSKDPKAQQPLFTKALTYYNRYLQKTPKPTPEALRTLATIHFYKAIADTNNVNQAGLKEALSVLDRALAMSIKPKEDLYQLRTVILQYQEDYVRVAEALEMMLKQNPQKKEQWQNLMGVYHLLAEKAPDPAAAREYRIRAILTLERAQALGFSNTPRDNMNLVTMYLQSNQFTKGTELLYNGMKKGLIESEPHNWRLLGRFYQEANFNDRAIEVLKEASKLFPKNGEIEWHIAQIYVQEEKMKEAAQHARAALSRTLEGTKPYSIHYLLAYAAFENGDMEAAKKDLDEAGKFEEAQKDSQFVRLRDVVLQELAEKQPKEEKDAQAAPSSKKSASR